jgi:phenylpropionate dioxygenase-like ring-hydroxylating dioxygenase large terminal subunit
MTLLDTPRGAEVVLSDDTRLADLFDMDSRKISGRVFSDPEIFELERQRLFTRSWIFVGMESEVAAPGDFVTRTVGTDSVILTRDHSGEISVLLNVCAHRAAQVCMVDGGATDNFRCPYHGWVYDLSGRVLGMPAEREVLTQGIQKSTLGMRRARVAVYAGLIFANWDPEAPEFADYMAEFTWYLDVVFGGLDQPMIVAGPPQRFVLNANWKLASDNFAGDGYHAMTLHSSVTEIGIAPPGYLDKAAGFAFTANDPHTGHSATTTDQTGFIGMVEDPLDLSVPWLPGELRHQLPHNLTPDQMGFLKTGLFPNIGLIFPNFVWLGIISFPGMNTASFTVRTFMPLAADKTEVWSWALVHPGATDDQKRAAAQLHSLTFGASGIFEQDDLAAWTRIQHAVTGAIGAQAPLHYICSTPPATGNVLPTGPWPGPGQLRPGFSSDDASWAWHLHWLHQLTT